MTVLKIEPIYIVAKISICKISRVPTHFQKTFFILF